MKRFTNILFVAEAGVDNAAAFNQAVTLANNNQAQLTVIGVVEASGVHLARELQDAMIEQRREELLSLVKAGPSASQKVEITVQVGKVFAAIIRDVIQFNRDLVIKSIDVTQRVGQKLFGGTDMKLLRKCPCPVWLIKSTKQEGFKEVLVALDYDLENPESEPLNRQLLQMATSIALSEFSELHVVHAWRLEHEDFLRSARTGLSTAEVDELVRIERADREQWLTKLVKECCDRSGRETADYLDPKLHFEQGSAENVVPKCAQDIGAELVVMGTVARTGIPGFTIGNTAENILGQLECSVLAIKPAGFISPVTVEVGR